MKGRNKRLIVLNQILFWISDFLLGIHIIHQQVEVCLDKELRLFLMIGVEKEASYNERVNNQENSACGEFKANNNLFCTFFVEAKCKLETPLQRELGVLSLVHLDFEREIITSDVKI